MGGVHRSFGTHISQVKSVRLDYWTPEQIQAIKDLGSKKANKIWEFSIPSPFEKITSHSRRHQRVKWITNKYILGRFRPDYIPTGPTIYSGKDTTKEEVRDTLLDGLNTDDHFR